MKKIIIFLLLISTVSFGQNLNEYKYALVPSKFSFLKETNQYNLNVMTKLFMEKYGFVTYLDNEEYSKDFATSSLNKVFVDLDEKSTMFKTTIKVIVKDYTNKIIYTSSEGISRNKEYKKAFQEALRAAFNSFDQLNHTYTEKLSFTENASKKKDLETKTTSSIENNLPVSSAITSNDNQNILKAKAVSNGYHLLDGQLKVVFKLINTTSKDFFIASKDSLQGVFFLKNNEWYFEFDNNEKLISEKVLVQF